MEITDHVTKLAMASCASSLITSHAVSHGMKTFAILLAMKLLTPVISSDLCFNYFLHLHSPQ